MTAQTAARPRPARSTFADLARLLVALLVVLLVLVPPVPAVGQNTPPATPAPPAPPVTSPALRAEAYLLVDAATGQILASRGTDTARPMASTTKVMTALLVLESLDPSDMVTVSPAAAAVGEESLALRAGEQLTVEQLLQGILVKSANDGAVALAEAVAGSEAAFVVRMNERAAELGMEHTRYANPYGLDDPEHHTSVEDLAHLWTQAMRLPAFQGLVTTAEASLPGGGPNRSFDTSNKLLGTYTWMVGGKTGFTNNAGRCLVASSERGGRRLISVVLGAPDTAAVNAFTDTKALLDHGFESFTRVRALDPGATVRTDGGTVAQASAPVDLLVRHDQLDRLAVTTDPEAAFVPLGPETTPASATVTVDGQPVAPVMLRPAGDSPPTSLRPRLLPPDTEPVVVHPYLVLPLPGREPGDVPAEPTRG